MKQIVLMVEDRSQVAEARRQAHGMANAVDLNAESCGRLALVVTEAATNIVKHAGSGRLLIRALTAEATRGLEVLAIDRGPGITNIADSLRDGHSTAGSPGTGLGSISRMASNLDIYSRPGKGTALRFEVWPSQRHETVLPYELGAVSIAVRGEEVCGDAWATQGRGHCRTLMVVDGLGHGPQAAAASRAALEVLARRADAQPADVITAAHAALLSTRGAAAAVATLDLSTGKGQYCGVGNISGVVYVNHKSRHLLSHNGTLGHNARKVQQFDFEFPENALLIMFSDGLITHWALEDYPGLAGKHPGLIAAVLYRDFERGRDDVTVTVLRHMGH